MQVVPHGGVAEIGGNCIEVAAGRARVLLDFGIPFGRYGDAFSDFLKPRRSAGMTDWLLSGVAPDLPGLYRQDYRARSGLPAEPRGFDAILVSHPHLDHLGLLPLARPDIPVGSSATAFAVAKAIEETGGSFDQTDFTAFRRSFELRPSKTRTRADADAEVGGGPRLVRAKGDEVAAEPRDWRTGDRLELDGVTARLVPVDHSIHGARGIVLEGEAQVAYSGDLRLHGRHREWTERFLRTAGGADVLLVEGTNVHNEKKQRHDGPLADFHALSDYSETAVESYIAERIAADTGYGFVAYPQRDLDRLETFLRVARKAGRKLCLTLKQAYLLDTVNAVASAALDAPVPSTGDPDVRIYVPRKSWGLVATAYRDTHPELVAGDYKEWERPYLSHPNAVTAADVRADPGKHLVLADVWNLTELHEFADPGAPPGANWLDRPGGFYVYSKTEPFSEEMELDHVRLDWWLRRWGLRKEGAHVSGHASLEELVWMADEVGARKVVPIHTAQPDAFAAALGPRAEAPRLGVPIVA